MSETCKMCKDDWDGCLCIEEKEHDRKVKAFASNKKYKEVHPEWQK